MNSEKALDFLSIRHYNISCRSGTLCPVDIAELCKGSTNDSDSFSPGSNPGSAAKHAPIVKRPKTSPSHGENSGSNPDGGAKQDIAKAVSCFIWLITESWGKLPLISHLR